MLTERLAERAAEAFCREYVMSPYLCCTEQGLHALFFHELLGMLPEGERYADWKGRRVCIVQKGYRAPGDLGRATAQHWDVAVLKRPLEPTAGHRSGYDSLRTAAVVEFGMNAGADRLKDCIARLSHPSVQGQAKYIVHLYRLSSPGRRVSARDLTPKSAQVAKVQEAQSLLDAARRDPGITLFYGMSDLTRTYGSQLWRLERGLPPANLL